MYDETSKERRYMPEQVVTGDTRLIQVAGIEIELWEGGTGRPLLLLHPGDGFDPDASYVSALTGRHRVIAPSCPGFGRSGPPGEMKSVDDLSYFYLDLLEELDLRDLIVVGFSFGGWLAAEIAVKSTERFAGLCLVDTVGVKFSDPMTRDIADLFSVPLYEHPKWLYHDPRRLERASAPPSDEQAVILARNHASFGLFGWSPTLHSRRLPLRLHRLGNVPTRLIWGEHDRIVPVDYGRRWQQAIPGARMEIIAGAGHYPQIEKPEAFVAALNHFVDEVTGR
jgi:pimeloyl-ACP methyl ester carboxylesterase